MHYCYFVKTEELNPTHCNALAHKLSILRRKIIDHAGSQWDGDNITLKADLLHLTKKCSDLIRSNSPINDDMLPGCPISFTQDKIDVCMRFNAEQVEADYQLQACGDTVGIEPEGWVPAEQ
jgi:hypothetical protein